MKIAMIGYGKMGKTIEKIALAKGHEMPLKINADNLSDFTTANLKQADVAIEFSTPQTAYSNIKKCLEAGLPVVCGTTAWLDQYEEVVKLCQANKGAFFYASNFSVGVNIFFKINQQLAKMMSSFEEYQVAVEEIHHTQKLDAPSGTAVTLTEDIIQQHSHYNQFKLIEDDDDADIDAQTIPVTAERIDQVPGTHTIQFASPIDSITLKHTAHSRLGFAKGALLAAEWIIGKQGVFGMDDMLDF